MYRSVAHAVVAVAWLLSVSCDLSAQDDRGLLGRMSQAPVELGRFHGTWFNADFIKVLSSMRSYQDAMGQLSGGNPLWVRIDSSSKGRIALVGFRPQKIDTMFLVINTIKGAGQKWTLGRRGGQPIWMIADDEQKRSYIALTPLDSMEKQPCVMGALPSKNQDPMFILTRMVNNSCVAGNWKTSDGRKYRFTNDLMLVIDGQTFRYNMSFSGAGNRISITTIDGQPRTWTIERRSTSLTLRPKKGAPITLQPDA
jgi:hypothetical protein